VFKRDCPELLGECNAGELLQQDLSKPLFVVDDEHKARDRFADVAYNMDCGSLVYGHRVIISSRCPMLLSSSNDDSAPPTVSSPAFCAVVQSAVLQGVKVQGFTDLLGFIYSATVPCCSEEDRSNSILHGPGESVVRLARLVRLAHRLQFYGCVQSCLKPLAEMITRLDDGTEDDGKNLLDMLCLASKISEMSSRPFSCQLKTIGKGKGPIDAAASKNKSKAIFTYKQITATFLNIVATRLAKHIREVQEACLDRPPMLHLGPFAALVQQVSQSVIRSVKISHYNER
jgi:hypothetical protein